MLFIGIDPGLDGAVAAVIDVGGGEAVVDRVIDTPIVFVKKRREYLPSEMAHVLENLVTPVGRDGVAGVVLEKVHTMPQQGIVSNGRVMHGRGIWEGILAAMHLPYTLVDPVRWKKEMMPDMPRGKGSSIVRALQLFDVDEALHLKKHHNRADAILLAEYCRRQR